MQQDRVWVTGYLNRFLWGGITEGRCQMRLVKALAQMKVSGVGVQRYIASLLPPLARRRSRADAHTSSSIVAAQRRRPPAAIAAEPVCGLKNAAGGREHGGLRGQRTGHSGLCAAFQNLQFLEPVFGCEAVVGHPKQHLASFPCFSGFSCVIIDTQG